MARLAVNELTTFRWSFEEDVRAYAAAGITAIGVWRQKLADVGDVKGAGLLAAAGLAASSLQWAGGFTGSDAPLAGFRSASRPHPASISTAANEMTRVNFMGSD